MTKPRFISIQYALSSLIIGSMILCACGTADNKQSEDATAISESPAINEDDLLLRLSAYLSMDTSRAAREQNQIVDYAIENLLDVQVTNSGLFYSIEQQGGNGSIAWGDYLSVHYKGYLLDGTIFADSRKQDRLLDFYVGNMIDAWNEGLQLIGVGGKIKLLVPSHLGYGEEGLISSMGRTIVAPYQILVFEIEVLKKH